MLRACFPHLNPELSRKYIAIRAHFVLLINLGPSYKSSQPEYTLENFLLKHLKLDFSKEDHDISDRPINLVVHNSIATVMCPIFNFYETEMSQFLKEKSTTRLLSLIDSIYLMKASAAFSIFYDQILMQDSFTADSLLLLFKDCLTVEGLQLIGDWKIEINSKLNLFQSIAFVYTPEWPFDQVFSDEMIARYMTIMGFLAKIRYARSCVNQADRNLSGAYIASRMRLLAFLSSFEGFIYHAVVEPLVQSKCTEDVKGIDGLISLQERFLQKLERGLMMDVNLTDLAPSAIHFH
jgi:hypothetical protein